MSAAITDKFKKTYNAANPNVARVTSTRTAGGVSLACDNLAGWPTDTGVAFITYRIDTNNAVVAGTQIDWVGVVSGNNIGTLTRVTGATDAGSAIGDVVEMTPTGSWANDIILGILAEHTQAGVHALTSSSTMTSPKLITSLNDTNGNELFKATATTSAVNEFTIANAATGNGPTLSATGGDTNVDMNFAPKGTGKIKGVVNHLYNPYKFRVSRNAAANTGNNAFAVVAYDTEQFDTSSNIASGVFTAPIAGFYQFNWSASATVSAGADETLISALFVDGVVSSYGNTITYRNLQGSSGSDFIQLAASQTVDVRVFCATARALSVGDTVRNYFSGFLVSAG
jgi:hypothetical protein